MCRAVGAWSHGFPGSSHYYWDTDIHSVVEKLAKYEQDVEKYLPDAKKALDDFKTAQRNRIEYSQKVRLCTTGYLSNLTSKSSVALERWSRLALRMAGRTL